MTEVLVSLPLDDGFLRRECPACGRQFKWHSGPTDVRPEDAVDPSAYHCPYCGESAPISDWLTEEQAEYAKLSIAGPAVEAIRRQLADTVGDLGGLLKIDFKASAAQPPAPLHEPHDMALVAPPCHPWEPAKVAEDWNAPLHCLVCGEPYALG